MSQPLPLRPSLDWLKKIAKERLASLRVQDPAARLSDAQFDVAREYGFASWRKLKSHVELICTKLDELAAVVAAKAEASIAPDDPDLGKLLAAIYSGDMPVVAQLLAHRPGLARAHGPEGQTPLHVAAQCNDNRLAVTLLACGADPQAKYGESGHTALSWAVTCNAPEFARTMVRLGQKPDLFCAAGIGALEHVRAFFDVAGALRRGASRTGSSRRDADGTRLPCPPPSPIEQISDALYIACRNAQADVVRFLLTKQPDLSFRAYMGGTALHWAYFGGSREVIDLLLQAGAESGARNNDLQCTPRAFGICVPASWGFADMVRARLAEDPMLADLMDVRTTPLCEAAQEGHSEVVRALLNAGADPNRPNADGKSPLDIAAEHGHAAVVELLRKRE